MLAALNDQLQERKLDSQYVTMLMAVWDDSNQTLQIANAGSVQPLFVAANPADTSKPPTVRTIQAEGFPLGLFPNAEYEEFTLSTQPGDLIVFFSDGIVDAVNATGDMFGDERLCRLLESQHHPTAQSTVEAILQAVTDFQAGTAHFDDETIVVLRVLDAPAPSH
jgi:sigma-B regulation protein RsbU (phosphoserine phosphatase)